MPRVSVIGAPGTGKTTFSARVAGILEAAHVELDALWWGPEWNAIDIVEFQTLVAEVVDTESWVIDGFYLDEAAQPLIWPKADVIVWLDLPRRRAVTRALCRSARRVILRTSLWGTNRQTAGVLTPRAIAGFVRRWPTYPAAIGEALKREALTGKRIVRLRDDRAKADWLASLAAQFGDEGGP